MFIQQWFEVKSKFPAEETNVLQYHSFNETRDSFEKGLNYIYRYVSSQGSMV